MTRQTIATGSAANDGTGDTLRQAAQKINDNFVEIYQFLSNNDSDVLPTRISLNDSAVVFNNGTFDTILKHAGSSSNRTITLPNASGNIVLDTATQTLTNKTLTTPVISSISNTGTLTLPTSTDTLVGRATSDTLTNKTIKNPLIVAPKIGSRLTDSAGNEYINFTKTTSAVNEITITNAATGTGPTISTTGTNTNIDLNITTKGTGSVKIDKVAYTKTTFNTDAGTIDAGYTYIDFTATGAITATLAAGTVNGEIRIFTHTGTGSTAVTPSTFAQGTSFTVSQNGTANCIWSGTQWFLTSYDSDRVTITP